ncbi:MAG: alpha/beta fold hydrolase [Desulfocapsaceae bacterium]|nr:alpha/beta fold hydrolase [Desulfocapsaceae bacterium]
MPNTVINNVDLYYETHGQGMPLVLLAGLASDSQSWLPVIERLSRHYLVITLDNRGVGRTTPQDIETSIPQMVDDSVKLIKHLGFSSVNILGHSMGGFVALDLAIRYPDCVHKLILAGTAASNSIRNNVLFSDLATCLETGMDPELWFRNIFFWIFSEQFFENEAAVKEAVRYAIEYPYPQSAIAFRNQVQAIARYDCTKALSGVTAETMVISGKEDLLFPPEVCSRLAQAIPGATFSVIDKAAHSIHMEQPQVFTDCVLEFLRHR